MPAATLRSTYGRLDLIDVDGDALLDKLEQLPGVAGAGPTALAWGGPGATFKDGPVLEAMGIPLAADLDGDGARDLVLGSTIFWGSGPRAFDPAASRIPIGGAGPAEVVAVGMGIFAARFLRGDTNADNRVQISDAIAILLYLFQGGADLACLDAADADDNGALEITDAIRTLDHLFRSGPPLPEPFPGRGLDLTSDALGCPAPHGAIPEVPHYLPP